jgi:hypothetical protein
MTISKRYRETRPGNAGVRGLIFEFFLAATFLVGR